MHTFWGKTWIWYAFSGKMHTKRASERKKYALFLCRKRGSAGRGKIMHTFLGKPRVWYAFFEKMHTRRALERKKYAIFLC